MMKMLLIIFPLLISLCHAEEVRFLSWNVFMLPKPIKFSLQKERTDLIIKEILRTDSDIVLLQEAFSGSFQSKLKSRTKSKYPYQYYLKRKRFSFTVFGSGAYYMSKYPLKVLKKVYFTNCAKADCFASKGSAIVEFTLPSGMKIHVANTHLQAGKNDVSRGIRFKQLEQIKNAFASTSKPGVPQILAGDINIDALSGDDFDKFLDLMEMSSIPLEGEPDYTNGFPTVCYKKPGDDQKEWIDHLITDGPYVIQKKVIPAYGVIKGRECPLSDHYAVESLLQL